MRVLACTIPGTAGRLGRVLPEAELHFAYTTHEAVRLLMDKPVDLLLIGMRFDESRGLELPAHVQAAGLALPPFVGMRGARNPAATSPQVFDLPMWELGARDVIDFGAVPDSEAGNRHIAERLARCVK